MFRGFTYWIPVSDIYSNTVTLLSDTVLSAVSSRSFSENLKICVAIENLKVIISMVTF